MQTERCHCFHNHKSSLSRCIQTKSQRVERRTMRPLPGFLAIGRRLSKGGDHGANFQLDLLHCESMATSLPPCSEQIMYTDSRGLCNIQSPQTVSSHGSNRAATTGFSAERTALEPSPLFITVHAARFFASPPRSAVTAPLMRGWTVTRRCHTPFSVTAQQPAFAAFSWIAFSMTTSTTLPHDTS